MTDNQGIPAPNYTQLPNAILDVMHDMSEAELRVVLAISRKTFGWHKRSDELSISQLMELTGMSNRAVINGIERGMERGMIQRAEVVKGNPRKGFNYSLVIVNENHNEQPIVNENHKASELGSQVLVNESHTQKKGLNKDLKKKEGATPTPPKSRKSKEPKAPPTPQHPFVTAYRDEFKFSPSVEQRAELEKQRTDEQAVQVWRDTLKVWSLNRWQPKSIVGQLERYNKALQEASQVAPNGMVKRNGELMRRVG